MDPLASPPGYVRGQHYTRYVADVGRLVRAKRGVSAERLLLELIDAAEAEAHATNGGVAPWYYEQLANLYQRRGDHAAEQAILTRFGHERTPSGVSRRRLVARLRALDVLDVLTPVRPTPAGASPKTPAAAPRTCALAGCPTALSRKQMKYCSRDHARAAQRAAAEQGRSAPLAAPRLADPAHGRMR